MDEKKTKLQYILTHKAIKVMTAYYVVVILIALITSIWVMSISLGIRTEDIPFYTGISTVSVAAMLSCLQYLRRLYKACIDNRIAQPDPLNDVRGYGNAIYFALRPLYAVVFAVVADFALLSGVIIVSSTNLVINSRFMYLCIIVSSMIGFSVGRVLDAFEAISNKRIQSTLSRMEGCNNG